MVAMRAQIRRLRLFPDDWSDQSTTGLPEDRVGYGPPPDVQPPESEEEKEESDVPIIPR